MFLVTCAIKYVVLKAEFCPIQDCFYRIFFYWSVLYVLLFLYTAMSTVRGHNEDSDALYLNHISECDVLSRMTIWGLQHRKWGYRKCVEKLIYLLSVKSKKKKRKKNSHCACNNWANPTLTQYANIATLLKLLHTLQPFFKWYWNLSLRVPIHRFGVKWDTRNVYFL